MSHPELGRRPTIYDVAQEAGVSKSLVSLVLRGSPQVSPERRAAVQQAIERLHYRPSQAAAHLAGNRTWTIGVVLDDYRNLWFVELLDGIQEEIAPLGYRVAVAANTVNGHVESTPLDGFISLRVDGIVIATEPDANAHAVAGTPVVVAGTRDLVFPGADLVSNDDRVGGEMVTDHLLQLGHRTVGHLTGPGGAARCRQEGYEAAMRAAGLPALIASGEGGTAEVDGYVAACRLLDSRPDLSAIFAANDLMALGAAAAARAYDRQIPDNLSLVGYDNSPLAALRLIDLTTVDAKSSQVGASSARSLVARIADPTLAVQRILINPELVLRASTRPATAP